MMQRNAIIDDSGAYRYSLERVWNPTADRVLFIMLNPSTADANRDDATIRRCISFTASWGYGGLIVGNLFALRSPDPKRLMEHSDPVGPANDCHLRRLVDECRTVVAAWGNSARNLGSFEARQAYVRNLLTGRLHCLGTNKDGTPKHPVRLSRATELVAYPDLS